MTDPHTSSLDLDGNIPKAVLDTSLWKRIASNSKYISVVTQIRSAACILASNVSSLAPEYTDHSVRHMDMLWQMASQVLTADEVEILNSGEAFLLGAAFYLHDLGMAFPVTSITREQLRTTDEYKAAYRRFEKLSSANRSKLDDVAIREATRQLHAQKALEFATKPLPGLDRYLIEESDFRDRWAYTLGQVAESHHWTLEQIERSLGNRKAAPGPDGESLDLAYVACVLRIVDFSHINRQRALRMERGLRSEIPPESAVHWDGQADVTGPERDRDLIVFGCTKPIENVDAWWFFYDLALGLDAEIRSVYEYLRNRTISQNRFSLAGVKGVENPVAFNQYVRLPDNVLPLDIRVQPDSMERVVELLGGKHIYGQDELAPIRELIQNARDAIELRCSIDRANGHTPAPGEIKISFEKRDAVSILNVQDNGVGMTRNVVRKFLLGVGSDFWNSVDFSRDFSQAVEGGFKPIGKFGIGFLSVFMLGDRIEVETEAIGNKRILLTLHGIGRRGELREIHPTGHMGTEIRIFVNPGIGDLLTDLLSIVRARAPMLSVPMVVKVTNQDSTTCERIDPGWWKHVGNETLTSFVSNWRSVAYHPSYARNLTSVAAQ